MSVTACLILYFSFYFPIVSLSYDASFSSLLLAVFPLHDLISITFVLTKEKYMTTLNILYEDPHIFSLCQATRHRNPEQKHPLPGHGQPD